MTNTVPDADGITSHGDDQAAVSPAELAGRYLTVYRPRPREAGELWTPIFGPVEVPHGWEFLPCGDAYVTRQVKQGPHWVLKGRFNRRGGYTPVLGAYAPTEAIAAARVRAQQTEEQRAPIRERSRTRRDQAEERYRAEFAEACLRFLDFAPEHQELACSIARRATEQACEKHSGRVGRTSRLELDQKAELAVRACIRHAHTDYEEYLVGKLPEMAYREVKDDAQAAVDHFLYQHRVQEDEAR
jgi:hypothetical protein